VKTVGVLWVHNTKIWLPHYPPPAATREKVARRSLGAIHKAKAPPSATPATAITAVRNGSCSTEAAAPEDLEVEAGEDPEDEDDVGWEAGMVMLAEDEAPHSSF